jgi:hypothetical protein
MMETNGNGHLFDADDETTRRDVELELPPDTPEYLRVFIGDLRARERVLRIGQEGVAALHGAVGGIRETVTSIDARVVKLEKRLLLFMGLVELLRSLLPEGAGNALLHLLGLSI